MYRCDSASWQDSGLRSLTGRKFKVLRPGGNGACDFKQRSARQPGDDAVGRFCGAVVVNDEVVRHIEQAAEVVHHARVAGGELVVGNVVPAFAHALDDTGARTFRRIQTDEMNSDEVAGIAGLAEETDLFPSRVAEDGLKAERTPRPEKLGTNGLRDLRRFVSTLGSLLAEFLGGDVVGVDERDAAVNERNAPERRFAGAVWSAVCDEEWLIRFHGMANDLRLLDEILHSRARRDWNEFSSALGGYWDERPAFHRPMCAGAVGAYTNDAIGFVRVELKGRILSRPISLRISPGGLVRSASSASSTAGAWTRLRWHRGRPRSV